MISATFIHSHNKYLLSTYCGPGTVLGAGDTLLNQTKISVLLELTFQRGDRQQTQWLNVIQHILEDEMCSAGGWGGWTVG